MTATYTSMLRYFEAYRRATCPHKRRLLMLATMAETRRLAKERKP